MTVGEADPEQPVTPLSMLSREMPLPSPLWRSSSQPSPRLLARLSRAGPSLRYCTISTSLHYEHIQLLDDILTLRGSRKKKNCSLCHQLHPFDALSCLAQCGHLSYARSLSFEVWPIPTQHLVSTWFTNANRDDKRKFIRTLLPKSLISSLSNVIGLHLREILAHRKSRLAPLIKLQMSLLLTRHPLPTPRPKGQINYWQA